jgi:STE24 endopeptidase
VGQVIQAPILAGIIKIVHWGGDYFFLYLWAFAVLMTLFLMTIYPDLIAPLFDKYTPMPEGELKDDVNSKYDFLNKYSFRSALIY